MKIRRKYVAFFFIALGLFSLVLAVVFFLRGEQEQQGLPPEISGDTIPPVTAIFSPEDLSWHGTGFLATILDSDIGSGLAEGRACQYIIQDLGTREAVGGLRPCEFVQIFMPVGEGKTCSSSFDAPSSAGHCFLSSKAVDKAGNESSWTSALFLIDLTPPAVGSVSLPSVLEPGEERFLEAAVGDNGKVTRCDFFLDGKAVEETTSLAPLPCQEGESCKASLSYVFSEPGEHKVAFACRDAAGNVGSGEAVSFRVFVNKSPEISSCRVTPTRGDAETLFQFSVEASDPEGDQLSFSWDFGDGTASSNASASHSYSSPGTYMPSIEIQDPSGEKVSCATAWVIVE